MLSRLDDIIYPNRCEVIELASQRYIYPIYKNGSTSIKDYAIQQNYKILLNEQIKRISTVDIIIRDPLPRFLSGIKTFVYNTKQSNPELDVDTILYFAENYLFLNRHYAPQLSWLINLSRYTSSTTKFKLRGMESLSEYTPLNISPPENMMFDLDLIDRLSNNVNNEMFLRLDNILFQLIDQELTFKEILTILNDRDPTAYSKLKCVVLD